MLRQYLELKDQAGDALLLYRMGDFYELFFEDAQKAAPVLGIALTRRRHNDDVEAPMCGVPHHAFDNYLGKLLHAGFRVAVAEQVEDPATAKGLVRREIIRTHTPGTISDTELLEGAERCFLAAFRCDPDGAAAAWIEVSTGSFAGLEHPSPRAITETLARIQPREILVVEGWSEWRELWPPELPLPTVTPQPPELFSPHAGEERVRRVLGVRSLRGFGLESGARLVGIAGALLSYLESTQKASLHHIDAFVRQRPDDCLIIDRSSLNNLEVERTNEGGRHGSLVAVLDHCLTRMGSRGLHDWLVRPSVDLETIADRHAAVAELVDDGRLLERIRGALEGLPDLERLAARIGMAAASPRELESLRGGVDRLPQLIAAAAHAASSLLSSTCARLDPLDELTGLLHQRLADEPAAVVGKGVIASGWDAELDEQRQLSRGGKKLLSAIESKERERSGIGSLKIKYNKVFGYYLEISRANLDRVPEDYERRQTLTNAERFITPELKEVESKILSAEERAQGRERELFEELLRELANHAQRLLEVARQAAVLDVLASFAWRALRHDYCRPMVEDDALLDIRDGRHPVLEALQKDPPFVPNDCVIHSAENQIILLTGPNMGGKSTFLRQVALITLMAHAGSFVPASSATIGLTDRIFTRVGASDMLAKGESTFMVEMTETANILHHAGPKSLVILDEVGRGTATYDGLSLAWAIVEYLHDNAEHAAKVLFATHYHELTELSRQLPRLVNWSMAVKEWRGTILFLHRVTEGPSDRSYGIHVAELAGVPTAVCRRAEQILSGLEHQEPSLKRAPGTPHVTAPGGDRIHQLELFRAPHEEIVELLTEVDLDQLRPLDALNLLAELKGKVTGEH